jgi:predicted GNAT family N-acyltransferase
LTGFARSEMVVAAMAVSGPHVRLVAWEQARETLMSIRTRVFVEEQGVPSELERDAWDPLCTHALAADGAGRAIGTGRLLPDGHIGRMAVLASERGRGVGSAVLVTLMQVARERAMSEIRLHAQLRAKPFYERHGFVVTSGLYLEAGLEHVDMLVRL